MSAAERSGAQRSAAEHASEVCSAKWAKERAVRANARVTQCIYVPNQRDTESLWALVWFPSLFSPSFLPSISHLFLASFLLLSVNFKQRKTKYEDALMKARCDKKWDTRNVKRRGLPSGPTLLGPTAQSFYILYKKLFFSFPFKWKKTAVVETTQNPNKANFCYSKTNQLPLLVFCTYSIARDLRRPVKLTILWYCLHI